MQSVKRFADSGGLVLGICNGFQILCEAHLLPGVLLRNRSLKYICKPVHLRVENRATAFTQGLTPGEVLEMPIGHGEGNYFCDEATLQQLHQREQIIFRYTTPQGEITAEANPNGSLENIAGICNEGRNVLGMMPHPERASEDVLGMKDGLKLLSSLVESAALKQ
jgi:phosphoribosylformylglycinamidine synthase